MSLHPSRRSIAPVEPRGAPGRHLLRDAARDLRFGVRSLLHRPGHLAIVVLTLAVGVGGAAAIVGAVNGILLRPLPYPEADRLVTVWQTERDVGDQLQEVAPANFLDWRERATSFERLVAMEPYGLAWQSPQGPIHLPTWLVYEDFFDAFGTAPALGRTFLRAEHQPGRSDVVVLGHLLWRTRFGGDEDVVGRVLTLDGRPHTVVGVMPAGFAMPGDGVLWAPKVLEGWEETSRTSNFYAAFGRLRRGTSIAEASAELNAVAAQLSREHPRTNADTGVALVPLADQIVGGVRGTLWLLLGAVALVLAVVAASLASMQLARAVARRREFAVRAALGAGAARVTRQLVVENLVVAVAGAAAAITVAYVALGSIRALAPPDLPRLDELRVDARVMLAALALSVATVVSAGLLPTAIAARAGLGSALGQGGRTLAGGRWLTMAQGGLVVFQCAASVVLLVGAGLLVRSFVAVLTQPAGFRTGQVASLTVHTWDHYPDGVGRAAFVRDVTERLSGLPGVRAAGMASSVPLMESIGATEAPMTIAGAPPLPDGEDPPLVHVTVAGGDLFAALAIPLRAGRLFEERDDAAGVPVALVNEAFVRRFIADGEDPLTRRLVLGRSFGRDQQGPVSRPIVGVVGDVRRSALHEAAAPAVYLPHAQNPTGATALVVWGDGPSAGLLGEIRRTVWDVDPAMPIYLETTMEELVAASVGDRRFVLVLLSAFASMALLLAATGLFGLMSYVTAQRTREYGVRLALGAARPAVLSMVIGRGLALAGIGIAAGLLGGAAFARWLSSMLFEVSALDPVTFALAAAVLTLSAVAASVQPAVRAARTDPMTALRED